MTDRRKPGEEFETRMASRDTEPSTSETRLIHRDLGRVAVEEHRRYDDLGPLGQGGMGEVRLVRDLRLGRSLALKRLRSDGTVQADLGTRFLREAAIQGQLEHPAIVPVYDLAMDAAGQPYFTMRRVKGETLDTILRRLRQWNPDVMHEFPRHRLLSVFVTICRAVEFAHSRGAIHRDLKPANVMLGDYGEVYVLDWGIAKVTGPSPGKSTLGGFDPIEVRGGDGHATRVGTVLGTVGYMAPEQTRDDLGPHSRLSDVYALGAMLSELLTIAPPGVAFGDPAGPTSDSVRSSKGGSPHGAVPKELVALVRKAMQFDPGKRWSSVRALREGVERYLAGDRDLEKRLELSELHTERAREAMGRLQGGGVEAGEARKVALREVASALSMHPANEEAQGLLRTLMNEPPLEIPSDLLEERRQRQERHVRGHLRMLGWICSMAIFFVPIGYAVGILEPALFFSDIALWLMASAAAFGLARRQGPMGYWHNAPVALSYGALIGTLPALGVVAPFGVLILAGLFDMHLAMVRFDPRQRRLALGMPFGVLAAMFVLQAGGILTPPLHFMGTEMRIQSRLVRFDADLGIAALGLCTLVTFGAFVGRIWAMQRTMRRAELNMDLNNWQLGHLLPEGVDHHPEEPRAVSRPLP